MPEILVRGPQALEVRLAAMPEPGPGEVVVHVGRAGICGSDIHILHGSNPFAVYPRIIGHEFAGTVTALGDGVSSCAIGDHVVIDPVVSCGHCYPCRIGRSNVCANLEVMGVHRDGGFRDYVAVPAKNAVPVPADMPFGLAALAEPFSIAANVLDRTGCGPDDTVLIYGAGTVGVTVLQVAKLLGARCIVADIDEARLERALCFGADRVIHSASEPVSAAMRAENDGLGPTLVIDGAGIPALLDEACLVASPAGRIGLLGFSNAPSNLSQQEVVRKELTIVGSRLNRRLLPRVVEWLAEKRLDPQGMVTQVFAAQDARAAFDLIENEPQRTLKVQLHFS
ncbi:Zn-dependent oxidoreductase [Mesorhizobium sp. B2-3-12]|uniref:Zn-dependent oxidoreductase n=1 Tax=Mesorhizobium sp. B2-3-12 TaxID=2589952 RepID=UPI0011261550|nr:Zn-dependent oxidoreductase [Mesorhizobium sp. B2-3-12]TPL85040.1 Zn-dependent oxidoreductase [Mesorhizobium sp. B2-3-12]